MELLTPLTREQRTEVHQAFAVAFPFLNTRTTGGQMRGKRGRQRRKGAPAVSADTPQRILVTTKRRGGHNNRKGAKRGRGGERTKKPASQRWWLHFVLRKTGVETLDALVRLGRAMHVPASSFLIAGTKDKRAVRVMWQNTASRCVAHACIPAADHHPTVQCHRGRSACAPRGQLAPEPPASG